MVDQVELKYEVILSSEGPCRADVQDYSLNSFIEE